jgi:hypothetical protein
MKRHVAAVANADLGYSLAFDKSCREVGGYEPRVLGHGRKWEGFISKLKYMLEWLDGDEVQPEDLVCVLDRFDIVVTDSLDRAFERFLALERETQQRGTIFISHDYNGYGQRYFFGTIRELDRGVNVGSFVIRAKSLRAMYTAILGALPQDSVLDDQRAITQYLNDNSHALKVCIDNNDLFLLFAPGDFHVARNLRFKHKILYYVGGSAGATRPVLVHRTGNADMGLLLRKLGYEPPYTETTRSYAYYQAHRAKEHLKRLFKKVAF